MSLIKGEKFPEREDNSNNQTRTKRVSLESGLITKRVIRVLNNSKTGLESVGGRSIRALHFSHCDFPVFCIKTSLLLFHRSLPLFHRSLPCSPFRPAFCNFVKTTLVKQLAKTRSCNSTNMKPMPFGT